MNTTRINLKQLPQLHNYEIHHFFHLITFTTVLMKRRRRHRLRITMLFYVLPLAMYYDFLRC